MAGYRPKSLDELNNLYDKSTNAKNEIYKKTSDLEVKGAVYSPAAAQTPEQQEPEKTREEAAAEEISGLVGDFIKSFGTPVPVKKVRPVTTVATPVKPVNAVKEAPVKPQPAETPAVPYGYAPVNEKPRLIRSDERNELFEDYKKVMDDDGEEEISRLRRGRRKGKKLFERKHSALEAKQEEQAEIAGNTAEDAASEISYEGLMQETPAAEPEIPETLENIDAVIEKVLGKAADNHSQEAEAPVAEAVEEAIQIIPEPEVIFEAEQEAAQEPDVIQPEEEIAEVYPEEEPSEESAEAELAEVFAEEAEDAIAPVEEVIEEPLAEEETVKESDSMEESTEELAPVTEASVEEYISILDEVARELSLEEQYEAEELSQQEAAEAEAYEEEAYEEEAAAYESDEASEESLGYEEAVIGENVQPDTDADENTESETEETYYPAHAKKRYAGKNILLMLIFFVLLLATAVSAVKAFSGINSDTLHLDKYYLFTAESSFEQAGINKGDLVLVNREDIKAGDVFAFSKGNSEYGFARFESELNEESIVADTDGQKSIVFKNTLRGVFVRTYPVIGGIASIIMSQYLYVVGALFLVAAILLLIVVFAFRTKKVKSPKKSKKEKEAELEDVYDEEASQQEQTEESSVDDDFRYLIQDDGGDDFDVYRDDYSDDEALPVYQQEDYKYEPDEYVNN